MYCCHKPYEVVGHVLDPDILEKKESFRTNMAACDVPCRMTAPNTTCSMKMLGAVIRQGTSQAAIFVLKLSCFSRK